MNFREKFGEIYQIKNRAARGREFEKFLRDFFRENNYDVNLNPHTARPRQSDLLVSAGGASILIEAKWQKRKTDISDVDDLRNRLRRTPPDIIGALFSMSGFTRDAINSVENDITREVLLFSPNEVMSLKNYEIAIDKLIERKRDYLRANRTVWFYADNEKIKTSHKLESSRLAFFQKGNSSRSVASESSDMIDCLFAQDIPDTTWGSYSQQSALLALDLRDNNFRYIEQILSLIDEQFGLSDNGSYSIRQWNVSWFGFGALNFLQDAKDWRNRYERNPPEHVHHSESLAYFDSFESGWMCLSFQQTIDPNEKINSIIHHGELLIQLPGIPLDFSMLKKFCREIDNQEAQFEFTLYHKIFSRRLRKPRKLEVVAEIVQKDDYEEDSRYVAGLVVKNPFFKKKGFPKELMTDNDLYLDNLTKLEFLVCDLRDWYELGDRIDAFDLFKLEAMQVGETLIMHPVCTWRNIVKRKRTPPQSSESTKRHLNQLRKEYNKSKEIESSLRKIKR